MKAKKKPEKINKNKVRVDRFEGPCDLMTPEEWENENIFKESEPKKHSKRKTQR